MKKKCLFKGIILVLFAFLVIGSSALAVQEDAALKISKGNTVETLTLAEIKAMPSIEDWGGKMRSTGDVEGIRQYKGVLLSDLCDLVGGLNPDIAVRVTARDGYSMTFSYNQVKQSDFVTYDAVSKNEMPHEDLDMILAYASDGEEMTFKQGGPLRMAILSSKDLVTDGHWWIKWVEEIELVPAPKEWTLQLNGYLELDIDRGTFESGAAENCHGTKWVDNKDREWEGIPLWLLVGRVDDENEHEDDAFNDDLVQEGYEVKIIAKDGYSRTLAISDIARKNDIIVAYKLNGEFLPEDYWPLRLVGEGLTGKDKVSQIKEISLIYP